MVEERQRQTFQAEELNSWLDQSGISSTTITLNHFKPWDFRFSIFSEI